MSAAYSFQEYDAWNVESFSNVLANIAVVIFRGDDLGGGLAALQILRGW
jgi:hypothetical protein